MQEIYNVRLFREEGFVRKKCSGCGRFFWTLDPARETCGDTPCVEYSFIGDPPTKRRYTLHEMEEAFLKFFEKRGHSVVKRYPVVARWRDDIFLTIASIAGFQPWVTSGLVPPPANPLVISQPSIRLKDIDNVGRSGRHFTLFFMGGHHAFNYPKKEIYWNHETVEFCHEFLTRSLRIKPEEITYIESFWEGGGNAGEDFEVNVRGLEVATLVFMRYAGEAGNYRKLPIKVVDTGYGMERLVWISQGTPTGYDAIFGELVERIRQMAGVKMPPEHILRENSKMAGIIDIESGRDLRTLRAKVAERIGIDEGELQRILEPIESIYAVADHLRCLCFMFADGITPSNVREGYLARLVLRRTIRMVRGLGITAPLSELVDIMISELAPWFPEIWEKRNYILQVVEVEEKKYMESLEKGVKLLERMLVEMKERVLTEEQLIMLYDSHGLPPENVKEIAEKAGVKVEVPEDFYIKVAKAHSKARHVPTSVSPVDKSELKGLKPTKLIFYDHPKISEFRARVRKVIGEYVVLDRTAFYPEGGGQPSDMGELIGKKTEARVKEVVKVGEIVLHRVEPPNFRAGEAVIGRINWQRRKSLMIHHTATHILLGALKRVLGEHVWQQGAQKGTDRSRLDISHFRRITPEEIEKIEKLCNDVIFENRRVIASWMNRNDAESKYGFELYQGGVVPGKKLRVVEIEGWNVQACAGTHCESTGEVGLLKILGVERIQDGIERLEFAAGEAALKIIRERENEISKISELLGAHKENVSEAVEKLFGEVKELRKKIQRMEEKIGNMLADWLKSRCVRIGELSVFKARVDDVGVGELIKTCEKIVKENENAVIVLGSAAEGSAKIVMMAGRGAVEKGVDCGKIMSKISAVIGGGGGGRKDFAQGGGTKIEKLDEALEMVVSEISAI
ncbi:MAG: alanine--tRNA ligase [Candidatus Hadarchaeales archaeon]